MVLPQSQRYTLRDKPTSWPDLADEIDHHDQGLAVFNTCQDAVDPYGLLRDADTFPPLDAPVRPTPPPR